MGDVRFRVATEVRKAVKGEKTQVPVEDLFHWIAEDWLAMRKAGHSKAIAKVTLIGRDPDPSLEELERLFRLEDPRG
ncbi:MAG TPA: hypothetical protein VNO32_33120 [Candidatus Acidoferrum sp.]|nr:hypothetical protein [Candidatus Acidoferrum sp.]